MPMAAPPASSAVLASVEDLRQRGAVQNDLGQPAKAARILRRALTLLDGAQFGADTARAAAAAEARVWISIATSESELNGHAAGLAALHRAEAPSRLAADPRLEFLRLSQLGYMTVRSGDLTAGLDHLRSAEPLLPFAQPIDAYRFRLNRGTTALFGGDLKRARTELNAAIAIATEQSWPVEAKKAQHNLGYLEYLAGNFVTALRAMDDVRASESGISLAVVLLDRSRVLLESGLHREADAALLEAHSLFRASRLWKDVGETELARAECALLGTQPELAKRLATTARARFRRRGDDRWRREAELVRLQADLALGLASPRVADRAVDLAAQFDGLGLVVRGRAARLIAAEAAVGAGRDELGRELIVLIGAARAEDPVSTRVHIRVVRAKQHLRDGRPQAVGREVRAGLDDLLRHQSRLGAIDLQTASAVHGRALARLGVENAIGTGSVPGIFAAVERGRAATSRLTPIRPPEDTQTAESLSELRMLAEELRAVGPDSSATAAVRRRMQAIEHRLRSRSWTSGRAYAARPPAAYREVARELRDRGASMVTLSRPGADVYAVVFGSEAPRLARVGRGDRLLEAMRSIRVALDLLAGDTVPAPIEAAVSASLRTGLAHVDEMFAEVFPRGDGPIVVSPSSELATLPWNLLPSLRGRPVVVTPSATTWYSSTQAATRTHDPGARRPVAAFAGPGLRHSADEVDAVLRAWSPAAAAAGRPTCAEVTSALATSDVVHLAAHGRHQIENPLFSQVRMDDGPLYAYELESTAIGVDHVVLSACELGVATIRPGDEPLGLTSVLLRFGVSCVVAGTARINDRTSTQFMRTYHELLAGGADSATAVAQAGMRDYDHPIPFACFGASWVRRG